MPPRDPARRAAQPLIPADQLGQIIGRRDIASVPWVGIAWCSAGVAISTILRPAAPGVPDALLLPLVALYGLIATGIACTQRTPVMRWLARQLPVYLLCSIILIAALSLLAYRDQGLATLFYGPSVPIAMYLGLVLPARWATAAILVQLLFAVLVQLANPTATPLEAATFLSLTVAGWAIGTLCRCAHGKAARIALMLSRSDLLTRTLNRRGFLEQFEAELATAATRREPIALLVLDLDDFKRVNDGHGHAAGDELLTWVGTTVGAFAPAHAAVGRLGGDELGVALRGTARDEISRFAAHLVAEVGRRISVSIGVATSEDGSASADDMLRIADAALFQSKGSRHQRVHALVAGSTLRAAGAPLRRPAVTFAALRDAGGPPERPARTMHYGWLVRGGLWVIAACGALVVAGTALQGAENGWGQLMLTLGPFWVAANLLAGLLFPSADEVAGTHETAALLVPATTLGFGIFVAMLADGGLSSPLVAAFYLKVLFDAAVLRRERAMIASSALLAWWAAVIACSPESQYWVLPYQAILFGVSHLMGRVGRQAFVDATRARLRVAHTDHLTQLRNRPGFLQGAERALVAAKAHDLPFGLLAFDLDHFKQVNDTHGHAAGDTLLRQVAQITRTLFPQAHSVARLGGDEFIVALPLESAEAAHAAVARLEEALRPIAAASVGWSLLLDDGFALEPLIQAADRRSYRAKLQRPATGDELVAGARNQHAVNQQRGRAA
ncbi:MAG: GGDEF domain-containing protein [Patulibacter sp.]